jgi:uncharacterized metal-binding protein YceD (DUF177 family)
MEFLMENNELELSMIIDVRSLGDRIKEVSIEANDEELEKLTKRMLVEKIDYFNACVSLEPKNGGKKVILNGEISAKLTQNCILTLEPVEEIINEKFEIFFDSSVKEEDIENLSIEEIVEGEIIEPLGKTLDGGEVVAEQLGLAINPYPKKQDAVFEYGQEDGEKDAKEDTNNPFSVLAKLKK